MAAPSAHLTIMNRAAERAGRSLIRDFGEVENLQVSMKGPADFVSAADRRAEEIIFEDLKKARPDYGFIMEESGVVAGNDSDSCWIIDPLDGTSNFLHGLPHWAISIALEHRGEIVAGLVYDPVKDESFHAEKNGGAFVGRRRLRVSGRSDLSVSMMATGAPRRALNNQEQFFKEYKALWQAGASLRRYGAAALDLAYVAAGRYEGFWERNLSIWDVAAGALLVKEAGGFISDLDNDRNNPVQSGNILAANGVIFNDLKKILRDVK